MSNRIPSSVGALCCWSWMMLFCLSGCLTVGDYYRARLQSPIPHERGQAIVALEQAGDAGSVPALIETLEDPDAGVRLLAIQALRRMCGTDHGYRYYHDESRRTAAVERWRDAVRNNEIVVQSSARHVADRDDALRPNTP